MEKETPIELIHRDVRVVEAYVHDKLERESSLALLRGLVAQLERVVPHPLRRARLPDAVRVGAFETHHERLVQLADGTLCVVNRDTGSVVPIFPVGFSAKSVFIVNHVLDRGSTNVCLMSFAQHVGLLWSPTWGVYHDLWNGVKGAAKKVLKGRWWLQIVRFAGVCNLNHGPFRSGAWGKAKQSTLRTSVATRTPESEDFREAARRTAALDGKTLHSDAEYAEKFRQFSTLPSCHEAGPVLKLARWMYIQHSWAYYRPELWLLRLVLQDMSPEDAWEQVEGDATALLDAELANNMTTNKNGLLARAHTYITQELLDVMDMFCMATAPARSEYKHRTAQVKTPSQGLAYNLALAKGGWEDECLRTLKCSFFDLPKLRLVGLLGAEPARPQNAQKLFDFIVALCSERLTRVLPSLLQYPHVSILLLDPDENAAREAKLRCVGDLHALLDAERDALAGDIDEEKVLQDIFWRNYAIVRLLLFSIRREAHVDGIGPETRHIVRALCVKLPDEKAPEDIHQHVRDLQRTRRHKHVTLSAVFDAQIRSMVLEDRDLHCPKVSPLSIATQSWRSLKQGTSTRTTYSTPPLDWHEYLNDLILLRRHWPSPTAPGYFESLCAWRWLLARRGGADAPEAACAPAAAWWSRLARPSQILMFSTSCLLVLCAAKWGVLVVSLAEVECDKWQVKVDTGSIFCEAHHEWPRVGCCADAGHDAGGDRHRVAEKRCQFQLVDRSSRFAQNFRIMGTQARFGRSGR